MATNQSGLSPYIDTGTGAYEGPPAEVTYGAEHDPEPTGLVDGPQKEVTVESPPDHLAGPTGADPGPPPSVEYSQHPAPAPKAAKAVKSDEVEDKAVRSSSTKSTRRS